MLRHTPPFQPQVIPDADGQQIGRLLIQIGVDEFIVTGLKGLRQGLVKIFSDGQRRNIVSKAGGLGSEGCDSATNSGKGGINISIRGKIIVGTDVTIRRWIIMRSSDIENEGSTFLEVHSL